MACQNQVYLVQPDEPVRLVTVDDPAIDAAAMGPKLLAEFMKSTGMDRSSLILTGEPTEYHVRPLSPTQFREVKLHGLAFQPGRQAEYARALRAFYLGCKLIKGWRFGENKGDLERDDWEREVEIDTQAEIGRYILRMSTPQRAARPEDDVPKS